MKEPNQKIPPFSKTIYFLLMTMNTLDNWTGLELGYFTGYPQHRTNDHRFLTTPTQPTIPHERLADLTSPLRYAFDLHNLTSYLPLRL